MTAGQPDIDPDRLWARLMRMAEIGGFPGGGVNRQALSDQDHAAWRQMLDWAAPLGLEPATDAAANLFLTLPGRDRALPPVLIGSHLDSQPTGGRFDGVFGVLASLETVEALARAGLWPRRDIAVVAWMNEEGSRFAPGMMGSEYFAGVRGIAAIRDARDAEGAICGAEIDRLHAAFPAVPLRAPFVPTAYIEPHIEQGPELEAAGVPIGVVSGIQGKVTCEVTLIGQRGHAGTAPMAGRKDAVMAFARVATALQDHMLQADPGIRFTIGRVEVHPNAPSVVAGEVVFRIDLRHPSNDVLDAAAEVIAPIVAQGALPCAGTVRVLVHAPSNDFDPDLCARLAAAAGGRDIGFRPMASAAGHDARHLAAICPSAMFFIPCKDGISHDPAESATPADVAAGAQVLLDTVLALAEQAP
ncbi:hydantoinase/carbamoylase family amidase [Tropicimonas sp. IMCC34043]|uniref:hydantoinase/carbamoylase family amidase n=1 Tax=Tropicimonas sp. IMCC34043 TaxID=2248760 RepID=UPI000E263D38|nr:hydantoinase/carbamoylase family amidase [Tropicimonas sp. IMCC34043]